ncbi:toast rack family protein [Bacillus sp. JJ722]|uniref:toast rack family protein n=1 Tax=Bacillus sp. JJ722 TaxID=3122973 RepID=UPI002FFF7CF5
MKKSLGIGIIFSMLLIVSGCSSNSIPTVKGKVKEESILIEKDKAKELDVELKVGAGELTVTKGAKDWVEGSIKYNTKKLDPIVDYDYQNQKGEVVIKQKKNKFSKVRNAKNDWNIKLSKDVPMKLSVNTGASVAKLDLQGLKLQQLNIETGVSDLTVDLSGKWKESFETNIETGVGDTTFILPSEVGVKIKSSKGIGDIDAKNFISKGDGVYVNEAYENADVILDVNAEIGIGVVTFKLDK